MKRLFLAMAMLLSITTFSQNINHVVDSMTSWYDESDLMFELNHNLLDDSAAVLYEDSMDVNQYTVIVNPHIFSRSNDSVAFDIAKAIRDDEQLLDELKRSLYKVDFDYQVSYNVNPETGVTVVYETLYVYLQPISRYN